MFIIAGISPKTTILDHTPRTCPACGLAQARLKRVDNYFNLFFIPLIRVKKGEPFIICDRCESVTAEAPPGPHPPPSRPDATCGNCGRTLGKGFKYCPFCGESARKS